MSTLSKISPVDEVSYPNKNLPKSRLSKLWCTIQSYTAKFEGSDEGDCIQPGWIKIHSSRAANHVAEMNTYLDIGLDVWERILFHEFAKVLLDILGNKVQ